MKWETVFGVAVVLVLSLAGCGSNRLVSKKADVKSVIWEKQDQFVCIESQDRESILVQPNDHPAKLSANLIRKALGSLEVQFEGKEKPVSVFSQDELQILGETVSRGLAQAKPHEDITFAIAGIHQGHTEPQISTCRLFVENDRLNLIIGTLHRKYIENSDRSRYPLGSASRKYTPPNKMTASWRIVPQGGVKYKTSGALTSDVAMRHDWLIFNLTPETFREDSVQFQTEQQDIHHKIEEMQHSIEQIKQNSTTTILAAPEPAESIRLEKIKQRLRILQELKNEGFVTDEDFRVKKQEILDSF